MSQIFHQKDGDVIEMIAQGDVSPSDFVDVGGKLGVALNGGAAGDAISVKLNGVIAAGKGAETHTFGQVLGADVAPTNTVGTGGALTTCATVVADSGDSEATVLVRLN